MTSSSYDEVLARRALQARAPELAGSSGYFAARGPDLDPALFFAADRLRPEVRTHILTTLYRFWGRLYNQPREWSTVWIAGSGITTAWNADREAGGAPGDLDCLIGIDYPAFFAHNPRYQGNSESALVHHFNQELHDGLWPSTANTNLNGSVYELTFYVNPGGSDIREINPYAAYDVNHDTWTVHPVDVPEGFSPDYFKDADRQVVKIDQLRALEVLAAYNNALGALRETRPGTGQYVNAAKVIHDVIRRGASLFVEIHDNRHFAFAPGGKGYFDPANYRWQAGKGNGTVPAMRALKQLDEQAHRDLAIPCGDEAHLLLVAALANGGRS